MLTFIVRRLAYSIPVVILASVLVFGFTRATTDPLARLALSRDPTLVPRERERLGLNDPLVVQYKNWATSFVQGDWGESFISRREVKTEIWEGFKMTLQLIVWGILFSALVAIGVGVYSAARQYSLLDYTFTGLSFLGLSMPVFWFALMASELLVFKTKVWFDLDNPIFFTVGAHSPGRSGINLDYARHLVLPVLTLSVQLIAGWSRYQRSSMLDVMSSDYIRTAKAKGLSRRKVLLKHGLRNALIPLTTVMAIDIGALFGGLIITEQIFSWPGMGRLFLRALLDGDTNMLMPWLMITAMFIILFNLIADVLYGVLDPRIRLS